MTRQIGSDSGNWRIRVKVAESHILFDIHALYTYAIMTIVDTFDLLSLDICT